MYQALYRWTRKLRHPSQMVHTGDEVEVVILGVDASFLAGPPGGCPRFYRGVWVIALVLA